MLSDSIHEILQKLKRQYSYYNEYPFEYSRFYKEDIREAMIKLTEVQLVLDAGGLRSREFTDALAVEIVDKFFEGEEGACSFET